MNLAASIKSQVKSSSSRKIDPTPDPVIPEDSESSPRKVRWRSIYLIFFYSVVEICFV